MRTLRLSLAGAVSLVLLGGLGGAVVANADEIDPLSATIVSGSIVEEEYVSTALRTYGNDRLWRKGARFETIYEWSDDRLPTNGWSVRNITHYAGWPEGGPTAWLGSDWEGTIGLDGPDGTWAGTIKGVLYPDGSSDSQLVLTGEGAYAGLSAILYLRGSMSPLDVPGVGEEPFGGGELSGLILAGPILDWEAFE